MAQLTRTTLAIEKDLLTKFDRWMKSRGYDNRSKAMRDLVRTALVEEEWGDPQAMVVAALSLIFDHGRPQLARELAHLQHEDHHAILCSQHVHLSHDLCLEVILMKGRASQLRKICDALVSARGVRAGKLTLLSTNV